MEQERKKYETDAVKDKAELKNELNDKEIIFQKALQESEKEKISEKAVSDNTHSTHLAELKKSSQSNSDLGRMNSGLAAVDNTISKSTDSEHVIKVINLFIRIVKNTRCSDEENKLKLLKSLTDWKDNATYPTFANDVHARLSTFFEHELLERPKEVEIKLDNLTKSVNRFTSMVNVFCESLDIKREPSLDISVVGDPSCFDISMCFSGDAEEEMEQCLKTLHSHVSSMQNVILKKELEIESLQGRLDSIKAAKKEVQSQIMRPDCPSLENKFQLLDTEPNKLIATCEECKVVIKRLEKEKQELEEEAQEMSEKLKLQAVSDDLLEISKLLAETKTELRRLKQENAYLKFVVNQCETLHKGQNVPFAKN